MLTVNAAAQAYRERRAGIVEIPMVWITAAERTSGEQHGIGLWKGEDIENIVVPDLLTGFNVTRTFYNRGLLDIGEVRYESGLNIRPMSLKLSRINEAVLVAFQLYEARGAEVQLYRRCYDVNRRPIAVEPWDFGYINLAPSERPAGGGEWSIEVEVVSEVRLLTQGSTLKKSHEAQRRRMGDKFRQYKGAIAQVTVPWGTADVKEQRK